MADLFLTTSNIIQSLHYTMQVLWINLVIFVIWHWTLLSIEANPTRGATTICQNLSLLPNSVYSLVSSAQKMTYICSQKMLPDALHMSDSNIAFQKNTRDVLSTLSSKLRLWRNLMYERSKGEDKAPHQAGPHCTADSVTYTFCNPK